jgi:hypothetical protein
MHETGVKMINDHFRTSNDYFRIIKYDPELAKMLRGRYSGDKKAFFKSGPESREFKDRIDLYDFRSFEEAYHQLMMELGYLAIEAIKLVIPENDDIENIYITGGFAKNSIFRKLVSIAFPTKKVYTSVINNGTALGTALVTLYSINQIRLSPDLGLTEC